MLTESKQNSKDETKATSKPNINIKIGLIGDSQIGKTTFMIRYIEDRYDEDWSETLGVNFLEKFIHSKNIDVTLSIWDLGGAREYAPLLSLVCQDAKCIFFCFDLTNQSTLFSIKRWYKEAKKHNKKFLPFLIGMKCDLFFGKSKPEQLNDNYCFEITKHARKFAYKMDAPLIFCSSLHDINIKKIFKYLVCFMFDVKNEISKCENKFTNHTDFIIDEFTFHRNIAQINVDIEKNNRVTMKIIKYNYSALFEMKRYYHYWRKSIETKVKYLVDAWIRLRMSDIYVPKDIRNMINKYCWHIYYFDESKIQMYPNIDPINIGKKRKHKKQKKHKTKLLKENGSRGSKKLLKKPKKKGSK